MTRYKTHLNLRSTYTPPTLPATIGNRDQAIDALVVQGLNPNGQNCDGVGEEYTGTIKGVEFRYAVAYDMSRYSHVCGQLVIGDNEYTSTFDHVYRGDTIPDLSRIADIINAFAAQHAKFPTESALLDLLPALGAGLTWGVTRNLYVSSSAKISADWHLSISTADTVCVVSNTLGSNAKSPAKVLERFDIASLIDGAAVVIARDQAYAVAAANRSATKTACLVLRDHPMVGGVSSHETTFQVALVDIGVDKIPALLDWLDQLKAGL